MLDVVQLRIGNLHVTEAFTCKVEDHGSGQSGSYKGPINKVKVFLRGSLLPCHGTVKGNGNASLLVTQEDASDPRGASRAFD